MAEGGNQLQSLTECCICLKEFTDPRMLPCIHTFCLGCLKQTFDKTNPGGWDAGQKNTLPCPLCRQEFVIPAEGLDGLKKNFFMGNLMEITQNRQLSKKSSVACDICKHLYEGSEQTKDATMRCIECKDNFCDLCSKTHTLHKSSADHHIVKIGCETEEDWRNISQPRNCSLHNQKPLDYYCPQCKKVFCVSCVIENHSSHKCKDVSTVEAEFRQVIDMIASEISTYTDEIFQKNINVEKEKESILFQYAKAEREIIERQLELKELIDTHTATLLGELSRINQKHINKCESQNEDIERNLTMLRSFETYCSELRSKRSAFIICSQVDELIEREIELSRDHEAFMNRPCYSREISFTPGNFSEGNIVGQIDGSVRHLEQWVIITGLSNGQTPKKEFFKLGLHGPQLIAEQQQVPAIMRHGICAAVKDNTMYVAGLGNTCNEIWKYSATTESWMKCTTLVQGRSYHSAAITGAVLYICGGWSALHTCRSVLDSVEAYNSVTNSCTTVGKLVHCVSSSGNCVPFRNSLYIFGGLDEGKRAVNSVQVYNTKQNVCTLLKPMPTPLKCMQAVHIPWQASVILIGSSACYIFNLKTKTWQERKQFKTDVSYFGLALENGRIFVIGGGIKEYDKAGNALWKCRDDVRYVPLQNVIDDKSVLWKCHSRLAEPVMIDAYGKIEIYSNG